MRLGYPTVAAMDGHCHAGGFMFAMAHDFRYFRDSGVTMSMSEINLNIPIPKNMMGPLLAKMNKPALRQICLFGEKVDGPKALEYQIVDKIFPSVIYIFELILGDCAEGGGGNGRKFNCVWIKETGLSRD